MLRDWTQRQRLFGGGFLGFVRFFEFQVLVNNLGNVILVTFMYQNPLPPDHHIGTEGPNIEAAASDEENLSFPLRLRYLVTLQSSSTTSSNPV
jgi:hypothetical protein